MIVELDNEGPLGDFGALRLKLIQPLIWQDDESDEDDEDWRSSFSDEVKNGFCIIEQARGADREAHL